MIRSTWEVQGMVRISLLIGSMTGQNYVTVGSWMMLAFVVAVVAIIVVAKIYDLKAERKYRNRRSVR